MTANRQWDGGRGLTTAERDAYRRAALNPVALLARHMGGGNRLPPATPLEVGGHDSAPVWMAALLASSCQAVTEGSDHAVRWDCECGRAVYTNRSAEVEFIEPLGVRLRGGDTLCVFWEPGETAYTFEVLGTQGGFKG